MRQLLTDIRTTPLLWLLVFVPLVIFGERAWPEAETLLFVLSVLAIVPLAALLSRTTESVAEHTGDAVGGLLNATLGNLTELVIAFTALQAGQYALVKASIAGAIVTNTLFMLGGAFLLGGLRHHVQTFNVVGARFQSTLLFVAVVALLVPSMVATADGRVGSPELQTLSTALAVLLIGGYALGLLFSLKTHKEAFAGAGHEASEEPALPLATGIVTLLVVTVLRRAGQRGLRGLRRGGGRGVRHVARLRRLHRRGTGGRGSRDGHGLLRRAQGQA